jgi:DNA-binding IclR family transcriptional regulator
VTQTVERALSLLRAVATSQVPLSLMELAAEVKLDKSTTARLLGTLQRAGLIARDPATKKYTAGDGLLALAAPHLARSGVGRLARPRLEAMREQTGETVTLHLRVNDERICIDGVESHHALRRVVPLGESHPLYQGPSGKVMLAFLGPQDTGRILQSAAEAGVDVPKVREQLAFAGHHGYLITVGDRLPGVAAISVPLFGTRGVIGSVTVAGPVERWAVERMQEFVPAFLIEGQRLSAALGGVEMSGLAQAQSLLAGER